MQAIILICSVFCLFEYARGDAQDKQVCAILATEECLHSILKPFMRNITNDEQCQHFKYSINCLRSEFDSCSEGEISKDVNDGIQDLRELYKYECLQRGRRKRRSLEDSKKMKVNDRIATEAIDRNETEAINQTLKATDNNPVKNNTEYDWYDKGISPGIADLCISMHKDYIYGCVLEGTNLALRRVLSVVESIHDSTLYCAIYTSVEECYEERILEKCSSSAAEIAKREFNIVPEDIKTACEQSSRAYRRVFAIHGEPHEPDDDYDKDYYHDVYDFEFDDDEEFDDIFNFDYEDDDDDEDDDDYEDHDDSDFWSFDTAEDLADDWDVDLDWGDDDDDDDDDDLDYDWDADFDWSFDDDDDDDLDDVWDLDFDWDDDDDDLDDDWDLDFDWDNDDDDDLDDDWDLDFDWDDDDLDDDWDLDLDWDDDDDDDDDLDYDWDADFDWSFDDEDLDFDWASDFHWSVEDYDDGDDEDLG